MKYIYQNEGWPSFTWDKDLISAKLVKVNKAAACLGSDDRPSEEHP